MSDTSPDIPALLTQFARRYRRRLLARAGILIALGLGCLGLLSWRLQALALGRVWVAGLPGALALMGAAALGWWLRRSWISRQGAANHLDQAFGLQQRLVTAAEFAQVEQKSSLYPLLLEDAARRLSSDRLRTPRPFTRVTAVLALALLLLLAWPGRGRIPLRLAQLPMTPAPPPLPSTPETSDQRPESAEQSRSSTAGRQQPDTDHASSPQGAGASPSQAGAQGQHNAQQTPPQGNAGSGGPSDAAPATGQGGSATQPGDPAAKQDGPATQSGGNSQPQSGASRPQQAGGKSKASEGSGRSSQAGSSAKEEAGRGGGQATMAQEAMQSEIQQLLKEVSGELQELQTQLAAAQDQPHPAPGTSTDPELYGHATALDRSSGALLPIQLDTDAEETKARRPGSGVGKPSGDVSTETPKALAENAQLSDTSVEETSTARQPLPPDYRNVFDRLGQQQ